MGFEPTTFCLASRRSTTELHPHLALKAYRDHNIKSRIRLLIGREACRLDTLRGQDGKEKAL